MRPKDIAALVILVFSIGMLLTAIHKWPEHPCISAELGHPVNTCPPTVR